MTAVVLGFFGDKFLGIECNLDAETTVSNLTQYKLFIGDGVTFSFNYSLVCKDAQEKKAIKSSCH